LCSYIITTTIIIINNIVIIIIIIIIIIINTIAFPISRYAESVGAVHFHTSAKTNKGLDEVFGSLAQSK
jgi:hypothetical protein